MGVFRENIGLLIVAFIISILVKGYVWFIDPPTSIELINIPIQAKSVPEGLSVSRIVPDSIEIQIKGPKSRIENFRERDIIAIADLSNINSKGEHAVRIRLSQTRFQGMTYSIVPDVVMVIVGQYEQKFFIPDKVIVGEFVQNRMISRIEGLPDSVEVSGSMTALNNVDRVVYDLDVNQPGDSWSQEVKFQAINSEGKVIKNLRIEPGSVEIKVFVSEHTISQTVPVQLRTSGTPKTDYAVKSQGVVPIFVEVSGAPEIIREIGSLETETVSISGISSSISRDVKLISPDPSVIIKPSSVKVTINVEQVTSRREIRDMHIEIRRGNTGYNYKVSPSTVTISIQGPVNKLDELDLTLIKPSVDVSSYSPGEYRVTVNAALPSGVSLIRIIPQEVTLTVSESSNTGRNEPSNGGD